MNERYKVTADKGRFRAEVYERTADGETYRSATFANEADARAWGEKDKKARQAAPLVIAPKFPVYEITQTETGTYRVTISGHGLNLSRVNQDEGVRQSG
jgi:hypothetical protein